MIQLALTVLLLGSTAVLAQPDLQTDAQPESAANTLAVSPEAKVILDRVNAHYASIPGASVTFKMIYDMGNLPAMPGMPPEERTDIEIVKPNLFKISGTIPISIQSNGTYIWESSQEIKSYSRQTAPRTMKQAAETAFMSGLIPGMIMDTFAIGLRDSILFEDSKAIDVVAGRQPGIMELVITNDETFAQGPMPSLYIGVPQEGPAWLQYVRMELPDTPQAAPPGPDSITFKSENWKVSDAPAAHFSWIPPAGWKKVDDLMGSVLESMGQGPGRGPQAQPDSIGKPAPDFTLESLDGQTISLASLKGKVVILDFWATWCGPCRKGLPVLMEIAESEASRGVVLWSVDLREPAQKVRSFLEKTKWDLPVLLDPKGEVATKYGVGGIPHTVVIGPNGNIVSIEVGYSGPAHTRKAIGAAIDKALEAQGS
ncbi:MAG: TlpA disulfide reductase family protein [Planctomycetota bacterium]|nr:TlpA disulfide reductase family protein [Planctomycetota bacterium]